MRPATAQAWDTSMQRTIQSSRKKSGEKATIMSSAEVAMIAPLQLIARVCMPECSCRSERLECRLTDQVAVRATAFTGSDRSRRLRKPACLATDICLRPAKPAYPRIMPTNQERAAKAATSTIASHFAGQVSNIRLSSRASRIHCESPLSSCHRVVLRTDVHPPCLR